MRLVVAHIQESFSVGKIVCGEPQVQLESGLTGLLDQANLKLRNQKLFLPGSSSMQALKSPVTCFSFKRRHLLVCKTLRLFIQDERFRVLLVVDYFLLQLIQKWKVYQEKETANLKLWCWWLLKDASWISNSCKSKTCDYQSLITTLSELSHGISSAAFTRHSVIDRMKIFIIGRSMKWLHQ